MNTFDDVYREMDKIKAQVGKDFRDVAEEVDQYLNVKIKGCFAGRMSPDGEPWAGNAKLIKTGNMLASLTGNGPGAVKIITPTGLEKGTEILSEQGRPYPVFQQRGVPAIRRKKKRKVKLGPPKPGSRAARALVKMRARRRRRKMRRLGTPMRIPPRPFIGLTPEYANDIAEITATCVAGRLLP